MENEETHPRPEVEELVIRSVNQLGEHCQSVRIFVTYQTEDGNANTVGFEYGSGNIYAQHGQIQQWLDMQREFSRIQARKEVEEGEE